MINLFKMRTESFYCHTASQVEIKTDSGGLGWGECGDEVAEVRAKDPPTVCRPHPPQSVLRPAASQDAMHLLCSKKVDVLPLAGGQDSRHSALSLSLSLFSLCLSRGASEERMFSLPASRQSGRPVFGEITVAFRRKSSFVCAG